MQALPDGLAWHGDHLIEAATADGFAALDAVEDGSEADGGLVHRVHRFTTEVDGAVLLHGFGLAHLRKAPAGAPLGQLSAGPMFDAPRGEQAQVDVVMLECPEGLDSGERLLREIWHGAGVVLTSVRWGDVVTWVPATPAHGAPVVAVQSAFLIGFAPAERLVPSLAEARRWLGGSDVLPGGDRGQRLRESGHTWPSVPTVRAWDDAADPWVVGGLLGRVADEGDRVTLLGTPLPRLTTLVPGGAPVLIAGAGNGRVAAPDDRLLTLWEGKDSSGRTVGVALHRSSGRLPALELPLWAGQRPSDPPDGWCGEVVEHEDEFGGTFRHRLRVTPFGRLNFSSRRIVAADPCVAGRSPALGLELASEGPFPVLRADLLDITEDGEEVEDRSRGILVVIDDEHAPVRWEPARDAAGQPITCVIDTGQLLLGDADGAHAVQREYDEGTADHSAQSRLSLHRGDPDRPADIAMLADLGGDGPAWVVVGVGEDDRPVAVLVANFDPLS